MKLFRRKQIFVDPRVQGAILERAIMYCLLCMFVIAIMTYLWELFQHPERPVTEVFALLWQRYAPTLVGTLFLLPFILYDVVRVSNRFVGPMQRLRRGMMQLASGEKVGNLRFRRQDFWPEMAETFNQMAARVDSLEPQQEDLSAESNLVEECCPAEEVAIP